MEHRTQLFDAFNVDDSGTVDTEKLMGIEAHLHLAHRLPDEIRVGATMQAEIISLSFHPVDLFYAEEQRLSPRLHEQAICIFSV